MRSNVTQLFLLAHFQATLRTEVQQNPLLQLLRRAADSKSLWRAYCNMQNSFNLQLLTFLYIV